MAISSQDVVIDQQPILTTPSQATGTNLHVVTDATSTTIATQSTGSNLHTVTDTGSTTVVTGNVTVVQPTGTNLHTVVDSGTITTTQPTSSSSTVTQVTSTGANQTVLASNVSRKKAILFFETGIWYVKFGATASASSKTYGITSNNTTIEVNIWVGQIDAFCTTAGKLVDVTELV